LKNVVFAFNANPLISSLPISGFGPVESCSHGLDPICTGTLHTYAKQAKSPDNIFVIFLCNLQWAQSFYHITQTSSAKTNYLLAVLAFCFVYVCECFGGNLNVFIYVSLDPHFNIVYVQEFILTLSWL